MTAPRAPGLVVGLGVALLLGCSNASQSPGGLTTDTDSRTLPDAQRRLEFLARYLRTKSPLRDAEYVIHYRDNSGGSIPGPSDWDIRAVLQVDDDGAAWHPGWEPCPTADTTPEPAPAWARELLDRRPAWRAPRAAPHCFRDPRHRASVVLVYADDHLVAYRTSSELAAGEPK